MKNFAYLTTVGWNNRALNFRLLVCVITIFLFEVGLPNNALGQNCCPDKVINLPVGYQQNGNDGGDQLRVTLAILRQLTGAFAGNTCFDSIELEAPDGTRLTDPLSITHPGDANGNPNQIRIAEACGYIGQQLTLHFYSAPYPSGPHCSMALNVLPRIICERDTIACNDPFFVENLFEDPDVNPAIDTCSDGITHLSPSIVVQLLTEHIKVDCDLDTIFRHWSIYGKDGEDCAFTCTDTTIIDTIAVDDIVFPSDTMISCDSVSGPYAELEQTGFPLYEGHPLIPGNVYCGLMVAVDTIDWPGHCLDKYQLRWRFLDWCNPTRVIDPHLQTIEIIDTTDPEGFFITPSSDSSDLCFDHNGMDSVPQFFLSAGIHDCSAMGNIPTADGIDACSNIADVQVKVIDGPVSPPLENGGSAAGLVKGDYCLLYQVIDECDNIDSLYAALSVVDDLAPTAVCIADYNVTLSNSGVITWISVDSLAGYFADNCGIEAVYGRRKIDWRTACGADDPDSYLAQFYAEKYEWYQIDGINCSEAIDSGYADFIPVCCEDVGTGVMVEILYIDQSCNTSTCWLTLHVEDKTPPTIIEELEDVEVDCDVYFQCQQPQVENPDGTFNKDSLAKYFGTYKPVLNGVFPVDNQFYVKDSTCELSGGTLVRMDTGRMMNHGIYSDNCSDFVEEVVEVAFDDCGGWIKRTFQFSNGLNKVQYIYVVRRCPLNPADFSFPDEVVKIKECTELVRDISGNFGGALHPDEIGELDYLGTGSCAKVAIGYWDKLFTPVAGSSNCKTVQRTWCVYDACLIPTQTGIPADFRDWTISDTSYAFKYVQYIHIVDTIKPELTIQGADEIPIPNCELDGFTRSIGATDNCGLQGVSWSLSDASGEIANGTGTTINLGFPLPAGQYLVIWTAKDLCGNIQTIDDPFKLVSEKKPELVMRPSMIVALNPMDLDNNGSFDVAMGEIWAEEYNVSSRNACTGLDDNLVYYIQRDSGLLSPPVPTEGGSLSLDCDDMVSNPTVINVLIWAVDTSQGTADYVNAVLIIQDNHNVCQSVNQSSIVIGGQISTEMKEEVAQVAVKVSMGNLDFSEITSHDGSYSFRIPSNIVAEVKPEKNVNHANGISTIDLLKIQKHILGIKAIDSPYKMIAADANDDGKINPIDLVQLRKLLIGKIDELPSNKSWRFVDRAHNFSSVADAIEASYPESVLISTATEVSESPDFVAVKIGDLNNTVVTSRSTGRSAPKALIGVEDRQLQNGEQYAIPIDLTPLGSMEGLQLQWIVDASALEIQGISSHGFKLEDQMVNLRPEDVRLSWSAPQAINGAKLILTVRALKETLLSTALSLGQDLSPEVVISDEDSQTLALKFTRGEPKIGQFVVDQNVPNPFEDRTSIQFTLPVQGQVSVMIYDASGRLVSTHRAHYEEGIHQFEIDGRSLPDGFLFYQVQSEYGTHTRKMLRL